MNTAKATKQKRKGPKKAGANLDFLASASKSLVLVASPPNPCRSYYRDSWHVMGWLKDSTKLLTCYGLSYEEALDITERLMKSGLCRKIERVHTWRTTARGAWRRSVYEVPL